MFHAVVTGTPGATTVSVVNGQTVNQFSSESVVYVLTGADPTTPIGVAGGDRQDTGPTTISQSYTASITGGQGFMAICDWNANSTAGVTAASGCTVLAAGTITGEISYIIVQRTAADGVVGVSTTLGVSGVNTNFSGHWAYAEVISIEAAVAARAQQQTLQQQFAPASNW
jgi:hypothetical protein